MDPRRRSFLQGKLPEAGDVGVARAQRPPWSLLPDEAFTSSCTRCDDCVRACPHQVLRRGDGGFPVIDFAGAGCSLCGDCRRACKSGAISRDEGARAFAWRIEAGTACLTHHGIECRVCGDACSTRALRFVPARGGIAQLQADREACTGCGECISRCPVQALALR